MQTRRRGVALLASSAAIALAAAGCASSGGNGPTPGASSTTPGNAQGYIHYSQNAGGTPRSGGVLNVLGTSDVDYMDPNITYYTLGYAVSRLVARPLMSYSGEFGQTTHAVPDAAADAPQVSADGKTYTVKIRQGVMWNTTPARQVTSADFVRGLQISCNPVHPFGGQGDYNFLVVGYKTFCDAFPKTATTPTAIKAYLSSHKITGVDTPDASTIVIHLTQPASFFSDMLTLSPFVPRPVEELAYVPGSAQLAQHVVSDGPYTIQSYTPGKTIDFVRNPAWKAETDPVRKAYVNEIKLKLTDTPDSINQQMLTNSPTADLTFATSPPVTEIPGLIQAKNPNLNVESEIALSYLAFNMEDPNNNGALKNVKVRQALEYAINRTHIIQDRGGPLINPAMTHVLPPQINGSKDFDLYPYNVDKAKALLKEAGVSKLTLTYLYTQGSTSSPKILQTLQHDLADLGITVKPKVVPDADIYTKYLEVPSTARSGVWDISNAGWIPDWYGEAALSFMSPLFDGRTLPPNSSNFGLYNSQVTNGFIDQGLKATSVDAAHTAWQNADMQIMKDAAIYPETNSNIALLHGSQVHNDVYIPAIENFDFSNVWLEAGKDGG